MNRLHTSVLLTLALALAALTGSCSEDCNHLPLYGTDANITSLTVSAPRLTASAMVRGDSVILITDCFTDLSEATATITLSEGATITPMPETITDWAAPHEFTVTSANGKTTRTYHYVVFQDAVELSSQEEVNTYGASKPTWAGNIVIRDSEETPITDLSPLSSLRHIEHGLTIVSNHLSSVTLPNLISAKLISIDGTSIENIAVPHLRQIANLRLGYTTRLSSLRTLDFTSLQHIYGDFAIMTTLSGTGDTDFAIRGFEALEAIDGEAVMQLYTADLNGFRSLRSVNHLTLSGTISSFHGFENLKEIRGILTFNMLRSDPTLEGFRPDRIWAINLKSLQTLQNLRFMENITSIYAFIIQGGYCLKSLEGVENLRTIEDELYLSQIGITNLTPLTNLEHVNRSITITGCSQLKDFSGLKKCLTTFTGKWTVRSNGANPTIEEILNQ